MNEQWQMNKLISWKFYSKIHTLILKSNSRNTLVSSRLSRKRNLSILLSFLGVFLILKYKNLVLKTTTWWTNASHFVDGWHSLRCQMCLFPHPLCGWPCGFCGEGGYGWEFFPQISGVRNFSPDIWQCKIYFSALYTSWAIFCFSAGYYFSQLYPCKLFPLEVSLQDIFSKITHKPLKSHTVGP